MIVFVCSCLLLFISQVISCIFGIFLLYHFLYLTWLFFLFSSFFYSPIYFYVDTLHLYTLWLGLCLVYFFPIHSLSENDVIHIYLRLFFHGSIGILFLFFL